MPLPRRTWRARSRSSVSSLEPSACLSHLERFAIDRARSQCSQLPGRRPGKSVMLAIAISILPRFGVGTAQDAGKW
jgi:hypothetical protein